MKEELKALGFSDEQITSIMKAHEDSIKKTHVTIEQFNELNTTLTTEKQKVVERDKQLESLKGMDHEKLQAEIERLKEENKTKDLQAKQVLESERKKNAVRLAWLNDDEIKPHDLEYILDKTDIAKIEIDEQGAIKSGFKEQRDNLIKDRSGLFEIKTKGNEEQNKNAGNSKPFGTTPEDGNVKPPNPKDLSLGTRLGQKQANKSKSKNLEEINPWAI